MGLKQLVNFLYASSIKLSEFRLNGFIESRHSLTAFFAVIVYGVLTTIYKESSSDSRLSMHLRFAKGRNCWSNVYFRPRKQ